MTLALHLKVCGALLLALACLHAFFPRQFRWKEELARLSLLNRQIFRVHCAFIVLVLVLFALLSLVYTETLLAPGPLARVVLTGLVIFWSARLLTQHFVYSPRLWRGNRLHTAAHVGFSALWIYFTATYLSALRAQFQ